MEGLFDLPTRSDRESDSIIAKKSTTRTAKATVSSRCNSSLSGRIAQIKQAVDNNLGDFKDKYDIVCTPLQLCQIIDDAIEEGVIAIDTETTGLDPLSDEIVGFSMFVPSRPACYVPVNHKSYITGVKLKNQISKDDIAIQLSKLANSDTKIIMFNASFDIRFLHQFGVWFECYWDCYIASRLLNENELHKNLKYLHKHYILNDSQDEFRFDDLFKGVTFDNVPIDVGYVYAAHDAEITYELYEFQKPFLDVNNEECIKRGLTGVSWVFRNIEMPCVNVVVAMEHNGFSFDTKYAEELSIKYHSKLDEALGKVNGIISRYDTELTLYKKANPNAGLSNPINIASPAQLSILFYDVLKIGVVDTRNPRGTGVEILTKIDHPIAKAILEYRSVYKLLSTFIDKLPESVNSVDGKIHCKLNQYGADTGRMSCQNPNLQQIPSHNHDIRKMFRASDGYVLMSADYSQQEPKCLAALCKINGNSQMFDTFMAGKDLYSEIASKAFHKPYEECREFNVDGTVNAEGKSRRTKAKSILLGVLYGRGSASVAEQLGCSVQEAEDIKQSVFRGFPAIKRFEEDSLTMAKTHGYVTTVCGRKRRLPDLMLPEFEFEWLNGQNPYVDALDFDSVDDNEVPDHLIIPIYNQLRNAKYGSKKQAIIQSAKKNNILVRDNGGKIADATRQCVNARIQGSASDLTKLAMIDLHNNKRLAELGFRLLIPVHDEIIAECPEANMKECAKLLAKIMSDAAEKILGMPIKCDVEITKEWYGEPIDIKEQL